MNKNKMCVKLRRESMMEHFSENIQKRLAANFFSEANPS